MDCYDVSIAFSDAISCIYSDNYFQEQVKLQYSLIFLSILPSLSEPTSCSTRYHHKYDVYSAYRNTSPPRRTTTRPSIDSGRQPSQSNTPTKTHREADFRNPVPSTHSFTPPSPQKATHKQTLAPSSRYIILSVAPPRASYTAIPSSERRG